MVQGSEVQVRGWQVAAAQGLKATV